MSKACSALVTQHYKNYVNFEEKLLSTSQKLRSVEKLDQQTSTVSSTEVKAIKSNNLQASFEYKNLRIISSNSHVKKLKPSRVERHQQRSPLICRQNTRDSVWPRFNKASHKDNKITHNFNEEQMTDEEKSLVANAGEIIRGLVSFSPLVDGQEIIVGKNPKRLAWKFSG